MGPQRQFLALRIFLFSTDSGNFYAHVSNGDLPIG